MAPSPDMFEMGVKVQVLKRGTLFASRAALLLETYRKYEGLEQIPAALTARLESEIFAQPLSAVWRQTADFFRERSPAEVDKAEKDAKHRMALVFRWYLGKSSRWAISGDSQRKLDYQIWCGPAMGAFNRWTEGSFLEAPGQRNVVQIALNLLEGAAVISRAQQLRCHGLQVPESIFHFRPRRLG
jgi:PfaD family protein